MATDGKQEVVCSLVEVGTIELEDANPNPLYSSLVVFSSEVLIVTDIQEWKLRFYRCQDGRLLAKSPKLETWPSDVCLINDTEVATILVNGQIEIMSVNLVAQPGTITPLKTLYVSGKFDYFYGVRHLKVTDNLLVIGRNLDSMCWGVVSLNDGLADSVHRICKYWEHGEGYLDTSPNNATVYICTACPNSRDNGVYGFDVRTANMRFVYRQRDLNYPTGISVDRSGFIYVSNANPPCIHQLSKTGELMTVHREGIPPFPWLMYWERQKGELFIIGWGSNVVRRFRPGNDVGLLNRLKRKFLGPFQRKTPQQHSQVTPFVEEDDAYPSELCTEPAPTSIPMEILNMDDTSLQLYKEALQDGKEKVYNIRVMVVGQHGVGKTTLTKRLLGLEVDLSKRTPTEGIDIYQHCCKISLETEEWILQQGDSDQLSRLNRLVRLLTNQAKSGEVIYQRESIPKEDLSGPIHDSDSDDDDDNTLLSSKSDILEEVDIIATRPKALFPEYQRDTGVGTSIVTVLEREGHERSKTDENLVEFLQLVNKNVDKLEMSREAYAALRMWDFAGQHIFYTTHQTFLTCRAIYLLVTDLTQNVTDLVNDKCYVDTEGARLYQVQDMVNVWLSSVHSCAPFPAAGTPVTSTAAGITAISPSARTTVTHPAPGTTVTSSAASTPVTSHAVSIPMTTYASGITLTSPAAGTAVTPLEANIPLTSPTDDTQVASLSAQCQVKSPTSGNVTSHAAGTTVTSPEANNTLTSAAASTPVISPAADTSVTSAAGNTLMSSAVPVTVAPTEGAITLTSGAVGTPLTSPDSVTPPVILVGTHVDKIPEDKRQEVTNKYYQQICLFLKEKPAFQHMVDFFAVDNTLDIDPQLETIKKRIVQLASQQPYWGEEVPANWLPLEEALMKLKENGIKVIQLSLVKEMNQAGSVPIKTAEQLDLFLRFQHAIGTILYFGEEGLKDWIVLDAQWLINAQKTLIATETIFFKNNPAILEKWFEFRDKGKLTPELIDAIWTKEKSPEFHYYKKTILLMMEKLNILARPRLCSQDAEEIQMEDYFLAPFMLHEATPKELISPGPNAKEDSTSSLCFVFTKKFLPSPIFHRLLAVCVAHWPIAKQRSLNLIFCGCGVFDLDPYHRLTMYFKDYVIFVRVKRTGGTSIHPSSKICREAREFIFENLSRIIGNLGHSLPFVPHIQCQDSDPDTLEGLIAVSLLQKSEKVPCHSHVKSHTLESFEVLKFWFEEEEHSDDESSAFPMPVPSTSDTDRFMRIAYLLVDIGSQVLRQFLSHHVSTVTSNLDQYLASNMSTINNLLTKRVLNNSQYDILFPPNGDDTNLDDYDITLLLTLLHSIIPSLSGQEKSMMQSLRDDRNKLYGHAKSCKMNASDYQTCWKSISSTLMTLSQQCGDNNFKLKIAQEIKNTQVSGIPAGLNLDIIKTWFNRIETVEESLETVQEALQTLTLRVGDLEKKKMDDGS